MNAPLLPRVSAFASLRNQNPKHLSLPRKILRRWDRNRVPELSRISTSTKPEFVHDEFERLWDQLLYSSSLPSPNTLTEIFLSLAKSGHFHRISRILSQLRDTPLFGPAFSAAISTFADWGQARPMEEAIASSGLPLHSATANARLRCHAVRGALPEMEAAYASLRRSGFCIDTAGIRAAASAYLRRQRLHELGEFARAVWLTRPDTGPLTWNLVLLSYAAGFKMKSLQREFLRMVGSGVEPDLTTFNVRALAFSRMSMIWDLHLSIEHMRRDRVRPDLVTYGCVVDAYAEGRLVRNLGFALDALEESRPSKVVPAVGTDPLVFEAMGKGDFHSSCEAFLEFSKRTDWTYRKLVHMYQKKLHRRDQIFWNY